MLQTHVSENRDEIEEIKKLFPNATDYTDVYDQAKLLTQKVCKFFLELLINWPFNITKFNILKFNCLVQMWKLQNYNPWNYVVATIKSITKYFMKFV